MSGMTETETRESMTAAVAHWRQAADKAAAADQAARERVRTANVERARAERELLDAVATATGSDPDALTIQRWGCEASPTGTCVGDLDDPTGEDSCLYCGQPEERK